MKERFNDQEKYFSHDADIGIIGRGKTIDFAFTNAAEAMFGIMTDLSAVNPLEIVEIRFQEEDIEFAFVTWLNLLIAKARELNFVFCWFQIHHQNATWQGKAYGELWRKDFVRGTEVKGATLTMLSVKKIHDLWEARCVVDV